MTPETLLRCQLPQVPKVEMNDKCGSDVGSCADVPKLSGDCNGTNKNVDNDKEEERRQQLITDVNVNGKDENDGSYVFSRRSDSKIGDPMDRDLNVPKSNLDEQVSESNGEYGETVSVYDICPALLTVVAPSNSTVSTNSSLVKSNLDGDNVLVQDETATAIVEFQQVEQIEPNSLLFLGVGHCGTPQLDDVKIKSDEQNANFELALELGEFQESQDQTNMESAEVQESEMAVLEAGDLCDGEDKSEEQYNLETNLSVADFGQVQESQKASVEAGDLHYGEEKSDEQNNIESTAECKSSLLNDSNPISEEESTEPQIRASQQQASLVSTTYLREAHESLFSVSKAGDLYYREGKSEDQCDQELTSCFQEFEEAQVVVLDVADCKLSLLDDNEVKYKEEGNTELESTTELECTLESLVTVSEATESKLPDPESCQFDNGEEKLEERKLVVVSEIAECKLSLLDDNGVNSKAEGITELDGTQESLLTVSEVTECKLPEYGGSESCQLDNREVKLDEEEKLDLKVDIYIKENQESQLMVTDNHENLVSETEVSVETDIVDEHVSDGNKGSCMTGVVNGPIDGSQNTAGLSGGSKNVENLFSLAYCTREEIEVGDETVEGVSCPVKDAKIEIEINNGPTADDKISRCNEVSSETDIGLHSMDFDGKVTLSSRADINSEFEVSSRFTDCACSKAHSINGSDPEDHTNDSLQDGISADMKLESEVESSSLTTGQDMHSQDTIVTKSVVIDGSVISFGSVPNYILEALNVKGIRGQVSGGDGDDYDSHMCQETKDPVQVQRDEISMSSPGTSADALDKQSVSGQAVKRPFSFLIKIPRYDDEKLTEQMRHAQLQVDEKTQQRDAIQVKIQMIKNNCQQLHNNYEAAKSEEIILRGDVKLKRQEIDSVQSVINRVKNATSVQDIDVRIQGMEHMLQHETIPLKEEKQFIREIKRLKHLREQLSSNMGSQDEVDQRDKIDEQLKVLKKELIGLKDKVSKAEATAEVAKKKYSVESKKLKVLRGQFRAADDIRQGAYSHLQNLRKQLYEKNMQFRMYKDDTTAANDFALSGDREALHRLCVTQVETIMELWNNNDEFRKEYVRCNARKTPRRLRTLDGRALGPDEESRVLPNVVYERIDRSPSTPGKATCELLLVSNLEEQKQLSAVEVEETDGKSKANTEEQMDQAAKTKNPGKSNLENGPATDFSRDKTEEIMEEQHTQTKEEQELAKKEEALRNEKTAAKLKEQLRLEEMAKANEALERKRRQAEKAQIRAEVRARREAEQREKEREKRARKKERKIQKEAAAETPDAKKVEETFPISESPVVTAQESGMKERPMTIAKRPQKPYLQFANQSSKAKSIPPPLRNRGKRRIEQWIWVIVAAVLVLALFFLGDTGFFWNIGQNFETRSSGF